MYQQYVTINRNRFLLYEHLLFLSAFSCRCHRSGQPSTPEGGTSAAKEEEESRAPWPPPRGRHPPRPDPVPCPCPHWGRTWPSAGRASRACASGPQEAWPPHRQQLTHGRRRGGRGARSHSLARRSRTYDGMWTAGDLHNATAFLDLLFCFSPVALFTHSLCVLFLFDLILLSLLYAVFIRLMQLLHRVFLWEAIAAESSAPVLGEPMDLMTALQLVMKKSLAHDGLVRGLHEAAKAIEKHAAQLCVLAEDCNQADYVKLVKALCADHNVHLVTVPSAKTLGEWAGVSSFLSSICFC
ncbi:hypothetical protein B296_00033615 [Ensete ventricosum]|uniref:40S ribosomal protein S12 n=1 Tax=Ensete ventricosum TaxID=4639 RepID=A0A427A4M8_ENSVE|nr:hypothetical protein B296_00033615 [Ensete ventricosum]